MGKMQLFCLPYAGGSSSVYFKWNKAFDNLVDVHGIELAGRGRRLGERPFDNVPEIVEDVYSMIIDKIDRYGDYAIFGHSFGGVLAYELVHKLISEGVPEPAQLFISASLPPKLMKKENTYDLSTDEFKKKLVDLGGTPEEVLENDELMALYIPILRADFKAYETYRFCNDRKQLSCKLGLFTGTNDDIRRDDIEKWAVYTSGNVRMHEINGGHLFVNSHSNELVTIIKDSLITNNT